MQSEVVGEPRVRITLPISAQRGLVAEITLRGKPWEARDLERVQRYFSLLVEFTHAEGES